MSKMEYMPVDCLQVPKVLFQMEKYKNLSNTAKILYSLFLDRLKFAVQNGWVDHNGDLFVVYPKSEMKKNLNMTRYGVDQAVQELVQVGKLVRIIPKNGQLYYRLLKYRYFEAGNTNEDVMLMLDDMPSTTYYRNRKKAIRLYATMLWAFTRPEKIQNKMEEINWKKSGSKVAVN